MNDPVCKMMYDYLIIVKRLGLGLGTGIGDWDWGLVLGTGIGDWETGIGELELCPIIGLHHHHHHPPTI